MTEQEISAKYSNIEDKIPLTYPDYQTAGISLLKDFTENDIRWISDTELVSDTELIRVISLITDISRMEKILIRLPDFLYTGKKKYKQEIKFQDKNNKQ